MSDSAALGPLVYGVQMDITWRDKGANHRRVLQMLAAEPPSPGALVVLPEMFATGFCTELDGVTETGDSRTEPFLRDLAVEYGITVAAGLVTTGDDGRGRNEAVIYGPDGALLTRYQKLQPFTGCEKANFTAGEEVAVVSWGEVRVSPFVCFDLRFPEHFRRAAGVELMLVIASWPVTRIGHWITLLQARAIENQCYVVGVNRTGDDPYLSYNGHSLIVDYSGAVLADAGEAEGIIRANLDLQGLRAYREKLPFLAEMRMA